MKTSKTKSIVLIALFVALITAGAFIKIPIPMVPFTLQTLFTMLAGLLLGKKNGTIAVCAYIFLGLAGLPVFTHGGGIGYIFQPSFGYIIGFAVGAYVTGAIANKTADPSYLRLLAAGLAGLAIVYIFGLIYFYFMSNLYLGNNITVRVLLIHCFLLTIPGDIVCCVFGASLAKRLRKVLALY